MSGSRRWAPWTLAALAYVGFVVSAYLTIVHYRGYVSPCYVLSGCEEVQTSEYSVILGVPVALAGAVFFGLMFYLGIGLLTSSSVNLVRVFKVLAFLGRARDHPAVPAAGDRAQGVLHLLRGHRGASCWPSGS